MTPPVRPWPRALDAELRAGDREHDTADEIGLGRAEEQVSVRQILGPAGPADRDEADGHVAQRLRDTEVRALLLRGGEPGLDEPRRNGVDVDAERAELSCEGLRQR